MACKIVKPLSLAPSVYLGCQLSVNMATVLTGNLQSPLPGVLAPADLPCFLEIAHAYLAFMCGCVFEFSYLGVLFWSHADCGTFPDFLWRLQTAAYWSVLWWISLEPLKRCTPQSQTYMHAATFVHACGESREMYTSVSPIKCNFRQASIISYIISLQLHFCNSVAGWFIRHICHPHVDNTNHPDLISRLCLPPTALHSLTCLERP